MRKIAYLRSAAGDLDWFLRYYTEIFRAGRANAFLRLAGVERTLAEHPLIGKPTHREGVREFHISRTPFSVIYEPTETRINVLRIWDNRRDPATR